MKGTTEEKFAQIERHLRSLDVTMAEIGYRYGELLMAGKGITNDSHSIERALSSLREFLEADRLEFSYRRFLVPASGSVRFAKGLNRSLTGSINDLICQATVWLAEGDLSLFDVGFRLNEISMSVLAGSGSPYGMPRKAFKALADSTGS